MASSNSSIITVCGKENDGLEPATKTQEKNHRSPFMHLDKASLDLHLPVSPTYTTTVFLMILDDTLLKPCPLRKRQKSNYSLDPTFLDTDSIFEDECSLTMYSTDDERDEEDDLLGLSFVEADLEEKESKRAEN
jgi:hypothetical protein